MVWIEKQITIKVLICNFCDKEINPKGIGIACRGCHKNVCSEHQKEYDNWTYCPECIKHLPEIHRIYEEIGENYLFHLRDELKKIKARPDI